MDINNSVIVLSTIIIIAIIALIIVVVKHGKNLKLNANFKENGLGISIENDKDNSVITEAVNAENKKFRLKSITVKGYYKLIIETNTLFTYSIPKYARNNYVYNLINFANKMLEPFVKDVIPDIQKEIEEICVKSASCVTGFAKHIENTFSKVKETISNSNYIINKKQIIDLVEKTFDIHEVKAIAHDIYIGNKGIYSQENLDKANNEIDERIDKLMYTIPMIIQKTNSNMLIAANSIENENGDKSSFDNIDKFRSICFDVSMLLDDIVDYINIFIFQSFIKRFKFQFEEKYNY